MSLLEHLDELRKRLVRVGIGLAAGFLLCWWQADRLMHWCQLPYEAATGGHQLAVMAVSEAFFVKVRVAFMTAVFVTAPWTALQAWGFVKPALHQHERRMAIPFLVSVAGFFIAGGAFGYFVGLPFMLKFLLGQAAAGFEVHVRAESYVSTFTSTLLGLGAVFEAPVLAAILSRLGLLDWKWLLKKIRPAILIIFVLAAVITPSGDIPTMLVFATPMLALYLLSVGVAWMFARRRNPA
jgi:sec-independent protein translocase protein TatC